MCWELTKKKYFVKKKENIVSRLKYHHLLTEKTNTILTTGIKGYDCQFDLNPDRTRGRNLTQQWKFFVQIHSIKCWSIIIHSQRLFAHFSLKNWASFSDFIKCIVRPWIFFFTRKVAENSLRERGFSFPELPEELGFEPIESKNALVDWAQLFFTGWLSVLPNHFIKLLWPTISWTHCKHCSTAAAAVVWLILSQKKEKKFVVHFFDYFARHWRRVYAVLFLFLSTFF